MMTARDWRYDAACGGLDDTDAWFPFGREGSPGFERLAALPRAICGTCPVREKCLTWALQSGIDDGIWGGLDPVQRRALRHREAARKARRRALRRKRIARAYEAA